MSKEEERIIDEDDTNGNMLKRPLNNAAGATGTGAKRPVIEMFPHLKIK